jgi:putative membrane protein
VLGYVGVGLGGLALFALAVMVAREIWSIARQSKIAHMHIGFATARAADDRDAARRLVAELVGLQARRGTNAAVRANLLDLTKEIIDGRDLIDIAERDLVVPLDREVAREIAGAAKRVSMVTAISPRALIDVAFVAAQALRLVRRISELYGGRPGFFGFIKLMRSVGAHLAITGGVAIGDSLIQQVVGHGIAARLSARLGEGVLNGMLTARVGLSAMAVCRPMPFAVTPSPGIGDVAPFLFQSEKKGANEARKS